jgi:hypothetical protein
MSYLKTIAPYFQIQWEDFVVKNQDLVENEIDIENLFATEELRLAALNFSKYKGYAKNGYGEGVAERGVTEQEAYDIWTGVFQFEQRVLKNQLQDIGINTLTQSMWDGLMLYYWATRKIFQVDAYEGIYETREFLFKKNYKTIANMIARSKQNKNMCVRAATIIMLADYGKNKSRKTLRSDGLFAMRNDNEVGSLDAEQLKRARFAYYAETLKFLPLTPESLKRDIALRYEETLLNYSFKFDGENKNFVIDREPSVYPVEKLTVKVNDSLIQNVYDYTINGTTITINKDMQVNDIITMQLKI